MLWEFQEGSVFSNTTLEHANAKANIKNITRRIQLNIFINFHKKGKNKKSFLYNSKAILLVMSVDRDTDVKSLRE